MYQDFIDGLNKVYNCSGSEDLEGLDYQHYMFAATSNSRALDAIGLFESYGFDMKGLKVLDIGCAYGGFSIEAAKRGAVSYGIEILKWLYDLAILNTMNEDYGEGSCDFKMLDATSVEFIREMPHDYFDLIIVNDVFEHVYDTALLLENISVVANKDAVIYFVIPNGKDLRFVEKEGHTGGLGLSLARPLFWQDYKEGKYNIYYRPYEYYKAMFSYYGFDRIVPINCRSNCTKEEITESINEIGLKTFDALKENMGTFSEQYKEELSEELEKYKKRLKYDLNKLSASELSWKYLTKFWAGFVHRGNAKLTPKQETTQKKSNSDLAENINYVLKRDGNRLIVEVNCDFPIDDYEFAFHLTMRSLSIERSRYQKNPEYSWKLSGQGCYGAAIYIKHKDSEKKDYRILTNELYFPGEKEE